MEKFITWVNEEDLEKHPVIKAAVFHHHFVWIHPFFDGNERTARLEFNWFFLKEGFPPAVILKADPKEYYKTLNDATNGYYKKLCSSRKSRKEISRYLLEQSRRYSR
jgi:Fic family protein